MIFINSGKIFERQFKNSLTDNIFYLRIKDSPSSFGKDSGFVRFTLNNPYDVLLFYKRTLFTLELKTTCNKSFTIQLSKDKKSKMIKYNQIEGLRKASQYDNIFSGFIFNFENSNSYFLDIKDFDSFLEHENKQSINENDIKKYNGRVLEKRLKRTLFEYQISILLDELIGDEK